jgi:hypothetical protein
LIWDLSVPHTLCTTGLGRVCEFFIGLSSAKHKSMSQHEENAEADRSAQGKIGEGNPSRISRRTTLFVLGSVLFALASLIVALEFFVVERIPLLTESDLENAKKVWQKHGPVSYDMDIELRGAQPGQVRVNVRNRVVTAETRDGRVPKEHTWETWSVPGMLNTLELDTATAENPEQAIQAAPATKWQLRCEFDPELGIPRRYHRLVSNGPEVYWYVKRFESR